METGIYGGTFNPVHLGHIHLLKAAAPCFDRILVMPDRVPPHKEAEMLASGEDRAAMLRLAVSDIPKAEVCTLELEAEGRSYTYLTLRKLRALYPDDRFTLIIGGDMLRTFKEWRNWEEILGNASLLAAARDDGEYERLLRTAADFPGARVLKVPPLPMSSTGVREEAAAGKPLTGMVPPAVEDYIKTHRLYQNERTD